MKDHWDRKDQQHDIGGDVDDCSGDVNSRSVDTGSFRDGDVPILRDRVAGEDKGKDDGRAVADDHGHEDVHGRLKPPDGRKLMVEKEKGEFGQGEAWHIEDRRGHDHLEVLVQRRSVQNRQTQN